MKFLSIILILISYAHAVDNYTPLLHGDHTVDVCDKKEPFLVSLCASKNPVKIEHAQDMQWGYRIALITLCFFAPGAIAQMNPESTVYEKLSCSAFVALPPAVLIGDLVWYGLKKYCIVRND